MRLSCYRFALLTSLLLLSHNSLAQLEAWLSRNDYAVDKTLRYDDVNYEKTIRSVMLYPLNFMGKTAKPPAVISLRQSAPLILEFDELADDASDLEAKIIHCNHDWQPSNMQPIEYLTEYNEFQLNNFEYSYNTKVPYVHYQFSIPRLKSSGNYLLKVYRDGDEDDLVLTRRFVVFEELARVGGAVERVLGSEEGARSQQINFNIYYSGVNLEMPDQNVFVTVRQNYRWDNAITDLKPLYIKPQQKVLEYSYFGLENVFKGGNEYRFFDFQNVAGGFQVKTVNRRPGLDQVLLYTDKPREGRAYNQMDRGRDLNGGFVIGATINAPAEVEADYAEVVFQLETGQPVEDGDIYVVGAFNNWNTRLENRMLYSPEKGTYTASLLLKEGRYDYYYIAYNPEKDEKMETVLEGSHQMTENAYDIIAYYRPFGSRGDKVIGYQAFQ